MSFHLPYETLLGRAVRLEPLTFDHAPALLAAARTPEDWAWLPIPAPATLDEMRAWIAQAHGLLEKGLHYPYAIVCQGSGEVAGSTRYMNVRPHDRVVEIGWTWLARAHQRTAVNTEAKLLLLTHAFERAGTVRVELKTDGRNLRSQAAIARLGAVREGVLRKHMITQGGFVRDTVMFGITDDEWPVVRDKLRRSLAVPGR